MVTDTVVAGTQTVIFLSSRRRLGAQELSVVDGGRVIRSSIAGSWLRRMKIVDAQSLWSAQPGWLNTATYGLPPTPAWDAVQSALAGWRSGQTSAEAWNEATDRSRESFARLVGVRTDQVAVGATVSELIGLVAAGVPDRARVVTAEGDFTSLLFPWLVHADRGFDVHPVPVAGLAEAVDSSTTVAGNVGSRYAEAAAGRNRR